MRGGPLAVARAAGAVLGAAARLAREERRRGLDDLVACLRRGRPLSGPARDPRLLAATVEMMLPILPPFGAGPCVKRSLLLVDLWSRCGLEPRLHLGVRPRPDGTREGHAWISVDGPPPAEKPTLSEGFVEMVVL